MQCLGDLSMLRGAGLGVAPETAIRVSRILTEGYLEMIEGQCLDLGFESRTDITTDEYLHMIACKTGALIRSAVEIGAVLANNDPAVTEAFSTFGSYLGRAFQIRDDYLGVWGDRGCHRKVYRQRHSPSQEVIPRRVRPGPGFGGRAGRTCTAFIPKQNWTIRTWSR